MLKFVLVVALTAASYGASIPEKEQYIVGGKDTDISKAPYQALMLRCGRFFCGGVIVAPTMILTTASCLTDFDGYIKPSLIAFRVGSSQPDKGGVIVDASILWVHPQFNARSNDNDVAVVELKQALNFSSTIQPIQLATSEPEDGEIVTVSGFGRLGEGGSLPGTLQSVDLPFVDRERCSKYITKYNINERMVCAGEEGKDACNGDGGGPLVYNGKLLGLSSFGIGCGRKDSPGVYTNVANRDIARFIRKFAEL